MTFLKVAAGNGFVIGVVQPSTIVLWGSNQLMKERCMMTDAAKDVFAGTDIAFVITQDGRLYGFGATTHDRLPIPYDIPSAQSVLIGDDYVIVLETAGTLKAWGTGLGSTIPPELFNQTVQSITRTGAEFVALLEGGTTVQWSVRSDPTS